MHAVGTLFPRGDRAPAIEPVSESGLMRAIEVAPALATWQPGRTKRVNSFFYQSQALELVRA
jgi:magnesium-protoporphyrin O-methyltransferase